MKLVIATIRPEKLEAVQAALRMQDVSVPSVIQVLGEDDGPECVGMYRGTPFRVRRPMLRLEIEVMRSGCSGQAFVIALDSCVSSVDAAPDETDSGRAVRPVSPGINRISAYTR